MKHFLAILIAVSLALPAANAQAVNCATPGADNAFLGIQTIRLWAGTPPEAKGDTCDDIPALLMRITCQKQIADAVIASGISKTDAVAIFGFVKNESQINSIIEIIRSVAKDMKRGDDLLSLDREKQNYLETFHKLPRWLSKDHLLVALKEKSVLLALAK